MDAPGYLYLAVTGGLFLVFAAIVGYTCSRRRRDRLEEPKHRIFDDD
ncbi:MAG: cbb3-type cytochrome c oxidase subunit 3 [Desulfuromonadales bacterium]|jgi:hypothetical protein